MTFFIRTEETREQAEEALGRGRSVRRWAFAGSGMRDMVEYDLKGEEQYEAVHELSDLFDLDFPEEATPEDLREALYELSLILEAGSEDEARAAEALEYEPFGSGYARFLDGLCALQEFDSGPKPEDLTEDFCGDLFRYLVCYEGDNAGWDDADEGWPLFRPRRIVWVHDRGEDAPCSRRERYT